MNELPSLTGTERARLEDHNWATATFTWANSELARLITQRKWSEAADTENAIIEQLENWEPRNGPNELRAYTKQFVF